MRIVIPGGSGQVGTVLARHLTRQGHAVTVLSRHPEPAPSRSILWDAKNPGDWVDELRRADARINLTGRC